MDHNSEQEISRKEFLHRSSGSLLGLGFAGLSSTAFTKKSHAAGKIEYRTLGRTGLKVFPVGFGTTSTDVPNVVKSVVERGVNFIDTGRMYANGKNEEMIGEALSGVSKNIIIQSKFHRRYINDKAAIEKSIDESLKALRTDYIDIMLIHAASSEEELTSPEVTDALLRAKESGKIGYTGFSSHTNHIELLQFAVKNQFYDVAMVPYNHAGHFRHSENKNFYSEWDQKAQEKAIENAVSAGMGIIAMKTCSAEPMKEKGQSDATFRAGLQWILRNKNISTMAVCMGNFSEINENLKLIE